MRANTLCRRNPPGSYFPQFRTYLNPFIKSAGEEQKTGIRGRGRERKRDKDGTM